MAGKVDGSRRARQLIEDNTMKKLNFVPLMKKAKQAKKAKIIKGKVHKVKVAAGTKTIEAGSVNGRQDMQVIPYPAEAFAGEIARVSAQWGFSLQIGEGEWQILRIMIELPCTVADLQMTKEKVIAEVIQESETQKRALLARIGQAYFGEQKNSPVAEFLQWIK